MKLKKLLAEILSAAMVLGTMVMPAFAETPEEAFQNAFTSNASTITLTGDVTINQTSSYSPVIVFNHDCTIDLAGNTLKKGSVTYIGVSNGANVTFKNGTIEMGNTGDQTFLVSNGDLTFENITAQKSSSTGSWCVFVDMQYLTGNSAIHFDDCTMNLNGILAVAKGNDDNSSYNKLITVNDTTMSTYNKTIYGGDTILVSGNSNVSGKVYNVKNVYTIGNDVTLPNGTSSTPLVATVTTTAGAVSYYGSFADAYAAAKNGDTITLQKDVTESGNTIQYFDKEITIDLNDHTFTVDPNVNNCMYIKKNVTFKNGKIAISDISVGQGVFQVNENTQKVTITLDNVVIGGTDNTEVGASIFYANGTEAEVVFNDCTVNLKSNDLDECRFLNRIDATLNNTKVSLENFNGAFTDAKFVLNENTEVNVTHGNYAVNQAQLEMNKNAKLTATDCQEDAIKICVLSGDRGYSYIKLKDTASLKIKDTTKGKKDINYSKYWKDSYDKSQVIINVAKNAILDADLSAVIDSATVTGKANAVSVEFEATDDANVYNIVLTAPSVTEIHEFTSAQLKFAKGNDEIGYEIAEANDKISVNEQGDNVYLFNLKSGADIVGEENKIVIGKVIFAGYSEDSVDFKIEKNYENKVVATKGQNITETFTVDNEKLTVNYGEEGIIDAEFKEPECEVIINVTMNEPVTDNKAAYQNMKVVISGQGLAEPIERELGSDLIAQDNDGVYTVNVTLKQKNTYIITVSGEGYRTAKYQLKTKEKETSTVNFWNNVQLEGSELVMETGDDTTKANANFIAGDIIKDNKLNIYDLSAVVAYFGDKATDIDNVWDKVKYDINRDGKIDAEDVSIVLNAWKALEALGQN